MVMEIFCAGVSSGNSVKYKSHANESPLDCQRTTREARRDGMQDEPRAEREVEAEQFQVELLAEL